MSKIVVVGSINKDIVFSVDQFVKAKETITSNKMEQFLGGKGLNQSIALKKAFEAVWLCGNIHSNDQNLLIEIAKWGVDVSYVTLKDTNTGTAFIQVDKHGENCIILEKGANHQFSKEEINDILNQCESNDLIVLQNEINLLDYIIIEATQRNIPVAFNPSPFEKELVNLPLSLLSYLLVNEVEAEGLSLESDPHKGLAVLAKNYPNTCVVLTLGSQGAYCMMSDQLVFQESFNVKAVDTTAAGDTFLGYFLGSMLSKQDVKEALRIASGAAALSVTKHGASLSIPSVEEVKAFLKGLE
jgi:ribokinase